MFIASFVVTYTGIFCNKLVISANGGKMPVNVENQSPEVQSSIQEFLMESPRHTNFSPETRLPFLVDNIYIPHPNGGFRVLSIGDILMYFGLAILTINEFVLIFILIKRTYFPAAT